MLLSTDGQTRPKKFNGLNIPDKFLQFTEVLIILLEYPLGFEFDSRQNINFAHVNPTCHEYLWNAVQFYDIQSTGILIY